MNSLPFSNMASLIFIGVTAFLSSACYNPIFAPPSTLSVDSESQTALSSQIYDESMTLGGANTLTSTAGTQYETITELSTSIAAETTESTTIGMTSSWTSSTNTDIEENLCGNGIVEVEKNEVCDDGTNNGSYGSCTANCSGLGPLCGDGNKDDGYEECDDGNLINDDFCTNNCILATCSDKNKNADETDVDCGGNCGGCALGKACQSSFDCQNNSYCIEGTCQHPQSCKYLLELNPMLKNMNGIHLIDPDGAGGNQPLNVFCDMTYDGGGWTRTILDTFETSPIGWRKNDMAQNTTTTCGTFGKIFGGYTILGDDMISKEINLLSIPHTHVRLQADFIAIDSWDGEPDTAHAIIENQWVWDADCYYNNNTCNQLSTGNQCGNNNLSLPQRNDGKVKIDQTRNHVNNTVLIRFYSNLNEQDNTLESWGVDNVAVYVR